MCIIYLYLSPCILFLWRLRFFLYITIPQSPQADLARAALEGGGGGGGMLVTSPRVFRGEEALDLEPEGPGDGGLKTGVECALLLGGERD